jgi:hypothetical protein
LNIEELKIEIMKAIIENGTTYKVTGEKKEHLQLQKMLWVKLKCPLQLKL